MGLMGNLRSISAGCRRLTPKKEENAPNSPEARAQPRGKKGGPNFMQWTRKAATV